jgi:hypothetical protein
MLSLGPSRIAGMVMLTERTTTDCMGLRDVHAIQITTLQKLEGFTYAMVLDLNMGYYTISLDPQVVEMFTTHNSLPWSAILHPCTHSWINLREAEGSWPLANYRPRPQITKSQTRHPP